MVLGTVRMFAAEQYRQSSAGAGPGFFMLVEALLFAIGAVLTFKAYAGKRGDTGGRRVLGV